MKPLVEIFVTPTDAQAWEVYTLLDTFKVEDLQRYIELALNFYEEVRVSRKTLAHQPLYSLSTPPVKPPGGAVTLDP